MTTFMKLLNAQIKKIGKETHMCVLPLVGVSPEMSNVYNYRGLSPFVDKVTVMCYDHSQEGSPPGPLAPFDWVEKTLRLQSNKGLNLRKSVWELRLMATIGRPANLAVLPAPPKRF